MSSIVDVYSQLLTWLRSVPQHFQKIKHLAHRPSRMADAPITTQPGTSSTPTGAAATAPASAAQAVVASATPPADPKSTPASDAAPPTGSEASPAPGANTEVTPPANDGEPAGDPAPPAPLFTFPETVKIAPEALSKLETFVKGKLDAATGKVLLSPQDIADAFVDQATAAYSLWQQQIKDQDAANKAVCQERFTPAQLAVSETAVGFLSSFDPTFRDFAARQLNDPTFVNAMRVIGERLSEDTLEIGGAAPPPPAKRSAAERMGYAKSKPN